jgi:hypothetical protein
VVRRIAPGLRIEILTMMCTPPFPGSGRMPIQCDSDLARIRMSVSSVHNIVANVSVAAIRLVPYMRSTLKRLPGPLP